MCRLDSEPRMLAVCLLDLHPSRSETSGMFGEEESNRPAPRLFNTVTGMISVVVAGCILSWLVLRQPAFRQALLTLVPHRQPAAERQLLAPRSILIAGITLALIALSCALVGRLRTLLLAEIPR